MAGLGFSKRASRLLRAHVCTYVRTYVRVYVYVCMCVRTYNMYNTHNTYKTYNTYDTHNTYNTYNVYNTYNTSNTYNQYIRTISHSKSDFKKRAFWTAAGSRNEIFRPYLAKKAEGAESSDSYTHWGVLLGAQPFMRKKPSSPEPKTQDSYS